MKKANELEIGDVIKPPTHERGWLKTNITVIQKMGEREDKGGKWLWFKAQYVSPNAEERVLRDFNFKLRPETQVKLQDTF